jgi:hypothetical protein
LAPKTLQFNVTALHYEALGAVNPSDDSTTRDHLARCLNRNAHRIKDLWVVRTLAIYCVLGQGWFLRSLCNYFPKRWYRALPRGKPAQIAGERAPRKRGNVGFRNHLLNAQLKIARFMPPTYSFF